MDYKISYQEALSHFVDIEMECDSKEGNSIDLLLPAWRPGRYELTNYAQNLRRVRAFDTNHNKLPIRKLSRNKWRINNTKKSPKITVRYQYYANQLDAGGSLLNEHQLYLNFINCLLYQEEKMHHPCSVELMVDRSYKIACGLPRKGKRLQARSYFQLVDAPLIASKHLNRWRYLQHGVRFNVWILGKHKLQKLEVVKAFKAFSREQINTMGSFPENEFHFLILAPDLKIYHGVEHASSTVIALGPANKLHKTLYHELLGVSSHELFHCWNVVRIRPKELLPYDFKKEVYFDTGFVAEGITTYYGDLFLVRSTVISQKQYFQELDKLFKRHFDNEGRHHASLIESSRDLWVDGYRQGAPGRKVSIYTKGALVALMLDLTIRNVTSHRKSLDEVMRKLWSRFGKKNIGYTLNDFQKICEQVAGVSLNKFFNDFVKGVTPLENEINEVLTPLGCQLYAGPSKQLTQRVYGFKTSFNQQKWTVSHLAQDSLAYTKLSVGDILIKINGRPPADNLNSLIDPQRPLQLILKRAGVKISVALIPGQEFYYTQYRIKTLRNPSTSQQRNFNKWLFGSK